MLPSSGDLLLIDGHASVQFAGDRALTLRVVAACNRPTYSGWVWLTGYVINRAGRATAKREIYVQFAGLRPATSTSAPKCSSATGPYDSRNDQGDGRAARNRSGLRARADAR